MSRTRISNAICRGIICVFDKLKWEVVVRFVDNSGIVDHHCLNFLFKIVCISTWSIIAKIVEIYIFQLAWVFFHIFILISFQYSYIFKRISLRQGLTTTTLIGNVKIISLTTQQGSYRKKVRSTKIWDI
jgi:hypothetical protein